MTGQGELQYLWCRVEEEGDRVNRVDVMHPNGEILVSYPPEHFEPGLVARMRAGQIRAVLSEGSPSGVQILSLVDELGKTILSESVSAHSVADPADGAER